MKTKKVKEQVKIINMTPHPIVVVNSRERIEFLSEGVIRVPMTTSVMGELETKKGKITLTRNSREDTKIELPVIENGVYYIVSNIVCMACPERYDFLIPNEGIRGNRGEIIGCKTLGINPYYHGGDI
jgi:TPP-dependent indolepyruvate ferredoxin oxidoreductase alpha subunit